LKILVNKDFGIPVKDFRNSVGLQHFDFDIPVKNAEKLYLRN
jgi:hypothetical protein